MHRLHPKTAYLTILGGEGFGRGLLFAALLSYWVVQARLNPLQLVLLGTALEATLFCLQIPSGAFADSVGRRAATVIGYAVLGAGLGLQALTRDFGWLMALQAVSGAGWAFLIGSIEAWIAEEAGTDGLERVYVRGGQAITAGLMVGLVLTAILGQIDPRLPILAGGAVLLIVSGVAAVLMTEPPRRAAQLRAWSARALLGIAADALHVIRASRALVVLVLIALALGISSEGWDRLYAAHLMRDLGLARVGPISPTGWLAAVRLIECVMGLVALQIAAPRLRAGRSGGVLAALYSARAVLMLGFVLIPWLPGAVASFLGAQVARQVGEPVIDAWIARETPAAVRATVLSAIGQADSLGQIGAGPLVGLLGNVASVSAALSASAALVLPAALLAVGAQRRSTKVATAPDVT